MNLANAADLTLVHRQPLGGTKMQDILEEEEDEVTALQHKKEKLLSAPAGGGATTVGGASDHRRKIKRFDTMHQLEGLYSTLENNDALLTSGPSSALWDVWKQVDADGNGNLCEVEFMGVQVDKQSSPQLDFQGRF